MLNQPLLDKLTILKLGGIKDSLKEQMQNPKYSELSFEDRLGLLVDCELTIREERRLKRRLKGARFRQQSHLADLDLSSGRGLDRSVILSLSQCTWIHEHLNVIITGATGVGKTYVASALGRSACEHDFSVRYFKTSRLLNEIKMTHADGSWGKLLDTLARIRLLILDDWFRDPLTPDQVRSLLEIFDDRYQRGSTILVSQLPVVDWHHHMKDPTLADAVLDRLVHNAYKIEMKGESRRKLMAKSSKKNLQEKS